jgi:hypothetical protein
MSVTCRLAVAATFAAVAVGAAPQAVAGAPEMSGHYTATVTPDFANGPQPQTLDWYFTPCGDGCANIASGAPSNPPGQAQLVNGLWNLRATDSFNCADGSSVPNAIDQNYEWDANTLLGTETVTFQVAACGTAPGTQFLFKLQVQKAA